MRYCSPAAKGDITRARERTCSSDWTATKKECSAFCVQPRNRSESLIAFKISLAVVGQVKRGEFCDGWDSPQFLQNVAQPPARLEGPSTATGRTRRIIVRYKETGSPSQPDRERVGVSARGREPAWRWRPPPLKGKNTIEIQEKDSWTRSPSPGRNSTPLSPTKTGYERRRERSERERGVYIIIRSAKWRPRGRCHYISRPSVRPSVRPRPSGQLSSPRIIILRKSRTVRE